MTKGFFLIGATGKAVFIMLLLFVSSNILRAQTITGTVYRDLNANGTRQTAGSFTEPGVTGVTVKAFDDDDPIATPTATATTTSGGTYTLSGLTSGKKYRLEFSWSDNLMFPGASGGTSVQVVTAPATAINAELNYPEDYCQTTPLVSLPCYVNGLTTGNASTDPAVISVAFDATGLNPAYSNYNGDPGTGPMPSMYATIGNVGAVWGGTYDPVRERLFYGTLLKRHSGMADGPGYIYVATYASGTGMGSYAGKFNLHGVTPANGGAAIDFGTVCRGGSCISAAGNTGISADYTLPSDKNNPSVDLDAYKKVGAMSYGDIDMQPESNLLWAVNAFEKSLISIDVSGTVATLPGTVNRYLMSGLPGWPTCSAGQLRPWALEFFRGKGYLGVTCDASTTQSDNDLLCYVLEFDPTNVAAGFTSKVTPFNPNFRRSGFGFNERFHYWRNTYAQPPMVDEGYFLRYSQPLLSDIEFDADGNMHLSIMDRFSHQIGDANYKPLSGNTSLRTTQAFGDLLKVCFNGSTYTMEGGSGCGGSSEFFQDESGDCAEEGATGGLALVPGRSELIATTFDPFPGTGCGSDYWNTQGFTTYSTTNGQVNDWYGVFYGEPPLIGKANGLGDITVLCQQSPIEIGNYIWYDVDRDGLQDPGETPLNNVTVELWADTNNDNLADTKVAETLTASNGRYLFSDSGANAYGMENWSFYAGDSDRLTPNTAYQIRIPLAQTALAAYSLSPQNAAVSGGISDNNARTDLRDSDASVSNGAAVITYTTGAAGRNNHTLDTGFMFLCPTPNCATATAVKN